MFLKNSNELENYICDKLLSICSFFGEIMNEGIKEYGEVNRLINKGAFEEAVEKARKLENGLDKVVLLCVVAEAMIYKGRKENAILLLKDAIKIAEGINEEGERAIAISKISLRMARAGETDYALQMVNTIKMPSERVYGMIRISYVLNEKDKRQDAIKILKGAKQMVNKMKNDINKIILMRNIAYAFMDMGMGDKAWDLVENAKNIAEEFDGDGKSYAYTFIAWFMVEFGRINHAINLVDSIMNKYDRAWLLAEIAYARKDVGLLKKAVEIAGKMDAGYEKVSVMAKITSMMAELGQRQGAEKLIEKCTEISYELKCGQEKAKALAEISRAMFEIGDERYNEILENAMEIAIKLEINKEDAISLIARILIEMGRCEDVMSLLNKLENGWKIYVLKNIMKELIADEKEEKAEKISNLLMMKY